MELSFPIEFLVHGTPVSLQSANPASKTGWKDRVKAASVGAIPQPHFASDGRIAVTLFYLPDEPMQGDVDNIVKLILDALSRHIYIDDTQVERVLVQKFEPGNIFSFSNPSPTVVDVISGPKPVVYIRIRASDDSGDDDNDADIFTKFSHDKPSDNVRLIAAHLFSKYGAAPFSGEDLNSIATNVGITVPERADATIAGAAADGKKLFVRVGRGMFKPTVHGETWMKATYGVKKGTQSREGGDQ